MSVLRMSRGFAKRAVVPVALFLALAAWALASPVGSSPDDDFHLSSIWCGLGERDGLCETGAAGDEREVPQFLTRSNCFAYEGGKSAACQSTLSTELESTSRGNFAGGYPPVFYGTMSVLAGDDISHSAIAMRLLNVALFVGAMTALFFMLKPGRRGPLVWGSLATLVPLGVFIIPSQNPSSWAVISGATLWVALVAYWEATARRPQIAFGALATLLTVMAAGARADAALYAAMTAVLTAVLAAPRTRSALRRAILPLALIAISAAFFLTSGDSGIVLRESAADHSLGGILTATVENLINMPFLWAGALGSWGLGWLDTPMPSTVWFPMIGIVLAVIFVGLAKLDRRKSLVLLVLFGALIAIPLYILVREGINVGAGVQPRYVYPLMIVLVGVATLGFRRDDLGLTRAQLTLVGVAVTAANAVALHTNIRRYVTGVDNQGASLDAEREWWWDMPLTPNMVWVLGVVSFAVAVAGVLFALRRSSSCDEREVPIKVEESTISSTSHTDDGNQDR